MEGDDGIVTFNKVRYKFDHVAMLATAPKRRLTVLEKALNARPLCRPEEEALRAKVRKSALAADDFIDVMMAIAASPEAFIDALEEASKKGKMAKAEFLPDDARHWDNLVGRWQRSLTIGDYAAHELAIERAEYLKDELGHALAAISPTFATPQLIPKDLLKSRTPEERLAGLTWLAKANDPFALIGVLQFCAEYREDPGLVDLGQEVLALLFDEMERLETRAHVFSAIFVLSTAALAEHEELKHRPPFWRRLAAHAHACLVLRASGGLKGPQSEFVSWAMANSGVLFVASVLRDFEKEPRWRPDWVTSIFVIADIYGRALNIVSTMQDAPEGWSKALEHPKQWLIERHAISTAYFPAPGEGARKPATSLTALGDLADIYRTFMAEPDTEKFVRLTTLVHAFVPPRDIETTVIELVRSLLRPGSKKETQYNWMALALAGHIAMLWQSTDLAVAVAETTITLVRRGDELDAGEAFTRLMECNAALADRDEASAALAGHLEALSFAVKSPGQLSNLLDLMSALRRFDSTLALPLGRAVAIAELGAKRAGASN
jgi:hypothetical protein